VTRRELLSAPFLRRAPFFGTFLQLTRAHRGWPRERWTELASYLRALGVERAIVQWTHDGSECFADLLPRVFAMGFGVDLGLVNDARFWTSPLDTFDRKRNLTLLRELKPFTRERNFHGWYLTEEIDDTRWPDPRALFSYLRRTATDMRRTARGPAAISTFANGAMPPAKFAGFCRAMLSESKIGGLLFQDSIGAKKLSLEAARAYFSALDGLPWRPVVEVFEQVSAEPFSARPASAGRIRAQLAIAPRAPFAFSLPEYATPLGGPEAAALFEELTRLSM